MSAIRRRRILLLAAAAGVALLAASPPLAGVYTEWLWFASLGQATVYQTRLWTQVGLWLLGLLLAAAMLGGNWLVIPRRLLQQARPRLGRYRYANVLANSQVLLVLLGGIAVLVAPPLAWAASNQWMTLLAFLNAVPFGLSDPIFHFDASFYVFSLPFYRFLTAWLLWLLAATLFGNVLLYLLTGQLRERPAVTHLSALGAVFLFVKAVDYQLQTFALLESPRGAVFGAGYADIYAQLPLLYVLTGVVLFCAAALLINSFARQWKLLLIAGGAWAALSLLGPLFPNFVQQFTVQPNELALERPYIAHNIRFTRYAYGLDAIQASEYAVTGALTAEKLAANADIVANVRLWDWRPLSVTYEQLQEIRTYYTFADVDLDRYRLNDQLRQVAIAVRELDVEQLGEAARTWVNQHIIYTHGYGACVSPVAEISQEGLPQFLVRDIPPQTVGAPGVAEALTIARPEIYFGELTTNYVIVNTAEDEFDYPSGDQNTFTRYQGPDGVPLSSFVRRLAFALRFDDAPILLSNAIHRQSRILFHRAISERVSTLAPMLWLDADPYPVIVDGRIVWMYDAYTWSNRFPYSEPIQGLNYIRNSVKITVDAYTGETRLYVVYAADPLIQTYQAIFPTLFTPAEQMEPALRAHWRYPEQLFRIQAEAYAAYHMEDVRVFYNREDLWQTPTEVLEGKESPMEPYYVIMRLPGTESVEFLMIRPYVPTGKQNMIAWLYADSDGPDYGQLGVYKFSKEALVFGPIQVEGRIDQDPYISQQLTLWNQRGSSVIRGNMMVIPLDGTLLYVEPLYLQAEAGRLPELKRVIAAHGNHVAMGDNLAAALAQLTAEVAPATPIVPVEGDVGALARSAQAHYQAAQECLRRGDWACYGTEQAALARDLESLVAATGE